MGGDLLSSPHVIPETQLDLFFGLEENAMNLATEPVLAKAGVLPKITIAKGKDL
jgi:hypothetical protein